MKVKRFYMKGYCSEDRMQAISEIRNIIDKHGFILDYKRYSDVLISLSVEIEEQKIMALYKQLEEYMKLEDFEYLVSSSSKECLILLNVTFTKSTGDMKIEVPAIPG